MDRIIRFTVIVLLKVHDRYLVPGTAVRPYPAKFRQDAKISADAKIYGVLGTRYQVPIA